MAQQSFFWDGNTVGYGQEELEITYLSMMQSGVAEDMNGSQTLRPTYSSRVITVAKGDALVGGHWYHQDGSQTVNVTTTNTYHRLVLRCSWASKTITLQLLSGSSSSYPSYSRTIGTTFDLVLCQFSTDSSGAIKNFKDTRSDPALCGSIRAKDLQDFERFQDEAKATWQTFMNNISKEVDETQALAGRKQVYAQASAPSNAMVGALWFDTTDNALKVRESSSWKKLFDLDKPKVWGIKSSSTLRTTSTGTWFSFKNPTAMGGCSLSTDFAVREGNSARIKTSGLYRVSYSVHADVSGMNGTTCHIGAFQMKDGSVNYPIGENFSDVHNNHVSGNGAAIYYLNANDKVSIYHNIGRDKPGSRTITFPSQSCFMTIEKL